MDVHALLHAVPKSLPSLPVHEEFPVRAMLADLVLDDVLRSGDYGADFGFGHPRAGDSVVKRHVGFGDLDVVGESFVGE